MSIWHSLAHFRPPSTWNSPKLRQANFSHACRPLHPCRLQGFVQEQKKCVRLVPLPPMTQAAARNWRQRLLEWFSIATVQAQMTPYASLYTAITGLDSNGTMYATGTTNVQSGCNCHTSSAYTTLTVPSGRSDGSTAFGPGEVAQATVPLTVTAADFTSGTTATANTQHQAYCPISGSQFVNNDQTSSLLDFAVTYTAKTSTITDADGYCSQVANCYPWIPAPKCQVAKIKEGFGPKCSMPGNIAACVRRPYS